MAELNGITKPAGTARSNKDEWSKLKARRKQRAVPGSHLKRIRAKG
jgi:hypothetical protein